MNKTKRLIVLASVLVAAGVSAAPASALPAIQPARESGRTQISDGGQTAAYGRIVLTDVVVSS